LPVDEPGPHRLDLYWQSVATKGGSVSFPAPLQAGVPMALTLHAPAGIALVPSSGFSPSRAGAIELDRAEWMARRVSEDVARFNRGSTQEQATLLAACLAFELQAKAAQ